MERDIFLKFFKIGRDLKAWYSSPSSGAAHFPYFKYIVSVYELSSSPRVQPQKCALLAGATRQLPLSHCMYSVNMPAPVTKADTPCIN